MKVGVMSGGLGAVLAQAIVEEAAERLNQKGCEVELVDLDEEIAKISSGFFDLEDYEPCQDTSYVNDEPRYPRPPRKLIMPKHSRSHRTGKRRR